MEDIKKTIQIDSIENDYHTVHLVGTIIDVHRSANHVEIIFTPKIPNDDLRETNFEITIPNPITHKKE